MLLSSTRLCIIASILLVKEYLEGRMLTASDMAATYNFNARSINPSLTRLVRVGILRSQVGGKGRGFVLSRDPRDISLFDIVNALEGSNELPRCKDMMYGVKCGIEDCESCRLFNGLNGVYQAESDALKEISLYDHFLSSLSSQKEIDAAAEAISNRAASKAR